MHLVNESTLEMMMMAVSLKCNVWRGNNDNSSGMIFYPKIVLCMKGFSAKKRKKEDEMDGTERWRSN